jgi:hypothetical protein
MLHQLERWVQEESFTITLSEVYYISTTMLFKMYIVLGLEHAAILGTNPTLSWMFVCLSSL